MSIFSLFTSRKPDVSKYAFVDTEVGTKDHKIHDIGALRYDENALTTDYQTSSKSILLGIGNRTPSWLGRFHHRHGDTSTHSPICLGTKWVYRAWQQCATRICHWNPESTTLPTSWD